MGSIDHPSHYRSGTGFEAIDVIEAWGLGFNLGNVVKYVSRAGLKGDALEDLRKARWYLDREIANLQAEDDPEEPPEAKPVPMDARLFTADGADGPLELVATEHGYVRVSLGGCHAYLPPSDARGLAGAVGKRADWGDEKLMSIAAMGDGSLWLRRPYSPASCASWPTKRRRRPMNEGLPLCGTFPHCDTLALDAFERFFGNPDIVRHLQSKKAASAMALSLCALMREDRDNVFRLACGAYDWAVSKDGTVEARP